MSAVVSLFAVFACDHTEPFAYTPPAARGPYSLNIPRQLTFNPGDDQFPSVQGGLVAYSLRQSIRADGDWCVAVLPDTGGEIVHELCPPGDVDTLVDAWRYPALSPDGGHVVFWKERGLVSNLVPSTRSLVVASLNSRDTAVTLLEAPFLLPDGSRANAVRRVTWPTATSVRLIAGNEIVTQPSADTIFTPTVIVDVDVSTHALTTLAGTLGLATYALAADGGIWFSQPGGRTVLHLAPGASATDVVATFPYVIDDIANAGSVPVVIVEYPTPLGTVPVLGTLTGTGLFRQLWTGSPPRSVSASPGSNVIVLQVPRVGRTVLPGSNLWMVTP